MNHIEGRTTVANAAAAVSESTDDTDRQIVWLLLLCPALACSDTVTHALLLGAAAIIAGGVIFAANAALRSCTAMIRGTLCLLMLATLASVLDLALNAWLHAAHPALTLFVSLLAANVALLWQAEQSGTDPAGADRSNATPCNRGSAWRALAAGLRLGAVMALLLSILALARELIGRGSLLHDAAPLLGGGDWTDRLDLQLFRVDMGFLLASLPPGAFISLGLLLAALNWLRSRPKHEQAQDR